MRDLAWIDAETTGLDPNVHELLEVAVVRTTADLVELDAVEVQLEPLRLDLADPRALELNGYRETGWGWSGVTLADGLGRVLPLLEAAIPAGQVIAFDLAFLRVGAASAGLEWPSTSHHTIDVPSLAWPLLAHGLTESLSQEDLCAALGVPQRQPAHRAMPDIRTTIDVARRLVGLGSLGADAEPPAPEGAANILEELSNLWTSMMEQPRAATVEYPELPEVLNKAIDHLRWALEGGEVRRLKAENFILRRLLRRGETL